MNKNKLITSLFTKQIKNITAGVQSSRTITTLQNKYEYDLAVIGGGSGGMACAKEAARNGAKVVLFDYVKPSTQNTTWGLGGTCVNVGCVPKKFFYYLSQINKDIANYKSYGCKISDPQINWRKFIQKKK